MIGKILSIGLLSVGMPLNINQTLNGFNFDWNTNYIFDINNDGYNDDVLFHFNTTDLGDLPNNDYSYSVVYYIYNIYQSVTNVYYRADAASIQCLPSIISANNPLVNSNDYWSAIGISYTRTNLNGDHAYRVDLSICCTFNDFWISTANNTKNLRYYALSLIGGEGSSYYVGDYFSGTRTSNMTGTYWQMGTLSKGVSNRYNMSQMYAVIQCDYTEDIQFDFYGLHNYDEGVAYNDGFNTGYDTGYDDGFDTGYDTGNTDGYNTGYDDGFVTGYDAGNSEGYVTGYNDGVEDGYTDGYSNGYHNGLGMASQGDFNTLFAAIADTPIRFLRGLFSFDLFGISVLSIVLSLITGLVVLYLVKKVWK